MAKLLPIPLATSSNIGRNKKNSQELLVNMMAVTHVGQPKNNFTLQSTVGFIEAHAFIGENILGIHTVKEIVYIVTSGGFYKADSLSNIVRIGNVAFEAGTQVVSIEDNGFDVVIVGGNGYYYNIDSNTLNDYDSDPAYYTSDTVAFMDGYFIFNRRDTFQFFISDLYSTNLTASNFASKEANPDNLMGVVVSNRSLWLIGRRSTEIWSNIGAKNFPFLRVSGAVHEIGTSNAKTISKIWDSVFFLGSDGAVYQTSGYRFSRVSTQAIEFYLRKQAINTAEAFTYSEEGHAFYCLTINNIYTFVYDVKNQLWHNRSSFRVSRWRLKEIIQYSVTNQNLGIDYSNGKLYQVSLKYPTEAGEIITREMYSSPIHNGVNLATMSEYQIDMVTGGLEEPTTDGLIKLQFSDDGGSTWSNIKEAKTGKLADFNKRVAFRRLGRFRQRTMKIIYQEPTQLQVLGTYARIVDVER